MFMHWFMGRLYEEKDKAEGGGAGGGAAGGGAAGGQGGAQAGTGAAGATQAAKPVTDDTKGQQKPATGAQGGTTQAAKPKAPEPPESDDDEEDEGLKPGDDGMLQAMSLKAFKRRVGRASNKLLRDLFGTTDKEAIVKAWGELPDLRKYKSAAEDEKRTEREKLEKRAADAEADAKKAREEAASAVTNAQVREYNGKLKTHLLGLVDKSDVSDMLDKLARAVRSGDVKSMKEARTWCEEFVEANPKWKKAEVAADDKAKTDDKGKDGANKGAPPPRKVPVSTSRRPGRPSVANGGGDGAIDFRTASRADIEAATGYKL